jgi:WD40 repeat protein
LVTAGVDYRLHFWRLSDGVEIGTGDGHKQMVKSLAFSGNGNWLASGSYDGEIRVWAMPSMALRVAWKGHQDAVIRLSMNGDGTLLAAGDGSGNVVVWNVADTDDLLRVPGRGPRCYVRDLVLSRDGDGGRGVMACAGDHRVYCWSSGSDELRRWETKGASVGDLRLDESGTLAATESGGHVQLWAVPEGRLLYETKTRNWSGSVFIGLTPDGKSLFVGDKRGIRVCTLPRCEEAILDEHEQQDGTGYFVLGDQGRVLAGETLIEGKVGIRVWGLPGRQVVAEVKGVSKGVSAVLPGGRVLVCTESSMRTGGEGGLALVHLG